MEYCMYSVQGLNAQKKLQMQLPSVKIWTKSTISSDYSSLMCMFKKRATLVWEAEAVKICLSNNYTLKTLKVSKLSHNSMLHQHHPPPPAPHVIRAGSSRVVLVFLAKLLASIILGNCSCENVPQQNFAFREIPNMT